MRRTRKTPSLIISPKLSQGRLNAAARDLLGNPTHVRVEIDKADLNAVRVLPASSVDADALRLEPRTGNLSTTWAKRADWEAGAHSAYDGGNGMLWFRKHVDNGHFFEPNEGRG